MHFRISKNGVFTDEDVYYQPDVVYEYIKKNDFKAFGIYRIVLGIIVAVYFLVQNIG